MEPSRTEIQASPYAAMACSSLTRPRVEGKFLYLGNEKLWIRGVTYGTFRPSADGTEFPNPDVVDQDFARILANGLNAIRTYTVPPDWVLNAAQRHGLRVMVGLPWEQHVAFLDRKKQAQTIEERVRTGVRACTGHPAILCYTIGNEIPASIVRWYGHRRVEQFIERLYLAAKAEDPDGLVTYVNYPSTEYLQLPFIDIACFNVYLESRSRLEPYLAHLHNIVGHRPLIMAEVGLDSHRHGRDGQACGLEWQVRTTFSSGCAGLFVFSWTDEWYRGGYDIEDWHFGLTTRDRRQKPALAVVRDAVADSPFPKNMNWPRISVVVCSYNGAKTIRDCLDGLLKLRYPNFEVIIINDGSSDDTVTIAEEYGFRPINTESRGLGNARNTGLNVATGEIIAYIDDDAYPDPDWLYYLAIAFQNTSHVGVGGPNISPAGDGPIADCVANAPGGPVHVLLSDQEAEHIPGCNMAFRKTALQAIEGFDPQFRTAGDDVDVCWRLQERGWILGYSPAAVIWHHRRNSIGAYWRQQQGYGKAEALLEKKWPEKYNGAGHLTWAGRVYAKGLTQTIGWRRGRVYHGIWGSALFQSVYQPAPNLLWSLPQMPEWYLVILALALASALGTLWRPLLLALPLLGLAIILPVAQACASATQAAFSNVPRSRFARLGLRTITAMLHLLQPLARLRGRMNHGLTPWRRRGLPGRSFPWSRTSTIWSERWQDTTERIKAFEAVLRDHCTVVLRGGDYDRWDLEAWGGMLGGVRLLIAIEEHGAGRQLLRFRSWPRCSPVGLSLAILLSVISVRAALDEAWVASIILIAPAALLAFSIVYECSTATYAFLRALRTTK